MIFEIVPVLDEKDCHRCFEVMRELRPHLTDATAFTTQVRRQISDGYQLYAAWRAEDVCALLGYRVCENLMNGRFLFVDDLVVHSEHRGSGIGTQLLGFARSRAIEQKCRQLVLDTGLSMSLAQRFYFRQGMLTRSVGFYENLTEGCTP
ncbi:GNAT family N-acetyltransferase [Endozoicomonas sp. G2_2]|uniref:GNAT family N-acetyltransferase n=1 Tax=Endozoicomonas sp. G2_2 TaxID=2821092 RepID=UPI001ADACF99|nr:GNAT family N-acetyltransferase [Endozoicomonas sp. G2_2]MBO9471641.1 GNAT family N-acetyltransferase [Endozoicomonas sp. G2_2]